MWLLAIACGAEHPMTADEHDRLAAHYDATAASIEHDCWRARSHELTVTDPNMCWKAQDQRFLEANLDAAAEHRATAKRMRAQAQQAIR